MKVFNKCSFFASQSEKKPNKTTFQILSWISNKNSRQIWKALLCPEIIRVLSIKLQRDWEYYTWHFSHLCFTMCVGTLTNRSQPFYKEHQKCHFVYLCIFILSLFWIQEFNRKHFKEFYSLSLCVLIGLCSICLFQ